MSDAFSPPVCILKFPLEGKNFVVYFVFFSLVLEEWQGFKKQFKKFSAVGNTMDSRTQVLA